jgi:peptide/nickel transport system permease protein
MTQGRYVLKRLGQGVFTAWLVTTTVFVLIRFTPGDPAALLAGPLATQARIEEVRQQRGLDEPMIEQYGIFLGSLVRLDFGTSFSYNRPAMSVVLDRFPYTLILAALGVLVTALIAIPLGVFMARRANGVADTSLNVVTVAGQSMPDFWLAIMLITVFAVTIPLFPTSGFLSWSALVLPVTTIVILQTAIISRLVRREMLTNLGSSYATVARGHGLGTRSVTWSYAFRNAGVPVVTALGTRFAAMLNGIVMVEVVFAWPGLGSLVVRALETRDYPLIQATVLFTCVLTILVQLAVDLTYPLLDPRVRVGAGVAA